MGASATHDHSGAGIGANSPAPTRDAGGENSTAEVYAETMEGALSAYRRGHRMSATSGLMDRIIGGGFAFVIGIIMLNFLFGLEMVNNSSGPFASQLDTIENVIGAAIILGVLGILALAGYYARSMLGGMN